MTMRPVESPLAAQPQSPAAGMGWPLDDQFSYYMSLLFAHDRTAALEAQHEIGKKLAADFSDGLKAAEQSSGLERSGPLERLIWYREKPDELWEEQEAKFPRRFERDMRDWERQRQRALAGGFGPIEQQTELALVIQEQVEEASEAL